MKLKNQKGFGLTAVLLIILVMGIIGGVGFSVYNKQSKTNNAKQGLNVTGSNLQSKTDTSNLVNDEKNKDVYAGWKEFTSKQRSISFKYPADWVLTANKSNDPGGADNSDIISPNGTKIQWLSDTIGLGGGCWVEDGTVKTINVEALTTLPGSYYVEYSLSDGMGIGVATKGPDGKTPQSNQDTGKCSYYLSFEDAGNPNARGILTTFEKKVMPADKDVAKLILKSIKY